MSLLRAAASASSTPEWLDYWQWYIHCNESLAIVFDLLGRGNQRNLNSSSLALKPHGPAITMIARTMKFPARHPLFPLTNGIRQSSLPRAHNSSQTSGTQGGNGIFPPYPPSPSSLLLKALPTPYVTTVKYLPQTNVKCCHNWADWICSAGLTLRA